MIQSATACNKTTKMNNFEWKDGYWCQQDGTIMTTMQPGEGSILCHALNEIRSNAKWDDAHGYGIKNLEGEFIYKSDDKFKIQRLLRI